VARTAGLIFGASAGVVRTKVGVIAADNTTLSDANILPASGFSCAGYDSIFIGVEIDAGTNPTADIELLFRDAEAPDNLRWKRFLLGARDGITAIGALASEKTGALASNVNFVEMRCFGHYLVFPRIDAVTNATSTTAIRILAYPGRTRQRAVRDFA